MMKVKIKKPDQKMQAWIHAQKRHRLSHEQVQMARKLGMNPAKLGRIDNHKQEPWKLPLAQFIEERYFERFGKTTPRAVVTNTLSRSLEINHDRIDPLVLEVMRTIDEIAKRNKTDYFLAGGMLSASILSM